ncbi:4a-hydroxytetrahydrobiopterin dehydratase [Paenibacillus radicis (ex Xue et al. 2023)]|uniref:4a-hydroxytetrahydrobiopterin dehydratase n=1 Tax=Paenibacillus radicis (ex Xue et al. 2023) TaxID=2972489 RepID=A0ABT1YSQ1_9BACL|nr:4a-hydroxytetrahydrobiopterin dehydratase [Paenibacillus radicis (ex Xue et al. 2023)]MCR8636205.1 4a-hydroxytetrahydrobiopterin dehydratase [Paenibacillus radicis (ex Xue et al. 2023)]
MEKLTEEEINARLEQLTGWNREADGKWIIKVYRFTEYLSGIAFVDKVASIAELELNHHPLIAIDYKRVTLRLTSWHAGGLSALDFEAAERFDNALGR